MGGAVASPPAGNGQEYVRRFGYEGGLLFGRQHEVAVALRLGGKGGKDAAPHAEIDRAEMGALFGALQA